MPPHGRVNRLCYPKWNRDKTDLDVVWYNQAYTHPFHGHRFHVEPSGNNDSCISNECVQRLWCTDSGVVGWYGGGQNLISTTSNAQLYYSWLGGDGVVHHYELQAGNRDGQVLSYTCRMCHGSLTVLRNTVYYFASTGDWRNLVGVPRLIALTFDLYNPSVPAKDLVHTQLIDISAVNYRQNSMWSCTSSIFYPSGGHAVTLSLTDVLPRQGAIDVTVDQLSARQRVHYFLDDTPSVATATREVVTFPHYTCRGFTNGSTVCYELSGKCGSWSWSTSGYGAPVQRAKKFQLPGNLFLFGAFDSSETVFRALAGLTPAFFVENRRLIAVVGRDDGYCSSGVSNYLVNLTFNSWENSSTRLFCRRGLVAPQGNVTETAYGALVVKMAAPDWRATKLVATSLENGDYYLIGDSSNKYSRGDTRWLYSQGLSKTTAQVAYNSSIMDCPVLVGWFENTPSYSAVAASSMELSDYECVKALLNTKRVSVNSTHMGCPLIAHGIGSKEKGLLLSRGADPNSRCNNGWTPLMKAVARGMRDVAVAFSDMQMIAKAAALLVRSGSAICTYPQDVLQICADAHNGLDRTCQSLVDARLVAPCEPGFFLVNGVNCSGLTTCSPGHYCPGYLSATNAEVPCPSGTYGPLPGMVSVSQCRPCPPERPFSAPGSADSGECSTEALPIPTRDVLGSSLRGQLDAPVTV